ncbi:helix-turn-helix domain-containing protein [Bradyrhizobium sp.]|uniref:helix-turn-helix domain-containing protein n=1 Tax=Bradyrhizobium sp. TaxID=376 RepID=UPI003C668804
MTERRRKRPLPADHFGVRLSEWRARRRESQLGLAISANISQRHLSFVESGRTLPSRDMVIRLCQALDIPLRARNELLVSAGYAALYPERSLDMLAMGSVREALNRIIGHYEPYPAFVVDRGWRVVMRNESAARLVSACLGAATIDALSPDGTLNFMRMMFEPAEMRPRILNWPSLEPRLVARLRNEARGDPQSPSAAILKELGPPPDRRATCDDLKQAELPIIPLELRVNGATLRLFNTITTFGTPQDVGLQELRIELSYPMDPETGAVLARGFERVPRRV